MNYYKPLTIAGIFAVICAVILYGVFYFERNLETTRSEHDRLERQRVSMQSNIKTIREQNKILSDVETEHFMKIQVFHSPNDFYSQIQQVFSEMNMDIISTRLQDNSIVMSVQGDYYNLMNTISMIRKMPAPTKVNSISIRRNPTNPSLIAADLTLETMPAK